MNQRNAVRSWLNAPYPTEVIFVDKVEGEGIEEILEHPQVSVIDVVKRNENGVPFINHIFNEASKKARYPIVCYLNADIILPYAFFLDVEAVYKQVDTNFLAVGQRLDVDVDQELTYSTDWEKTFWEKHNEVAIHPPTGSDFFVFPKGQYDLQNMPDLLVGRPGWDLWMIYNARMRSLKAIDLSFSSMVIHQNHDYGHKISDEKGRKQEDLYNYRFIPDSLRHKFTLVACDYYYSGKQVKKSYARGDLKKHINFKIWTNHNLTFMQKLMNKAEYFITKYFKRSFASHPSFPNHVISS